MFKTKEFEQNLSGPVCIVEDYYYQYPFTDKWTLRGIDFQIAPGEIIAVFGESGSGKTTLFSSIGGFNHHFYKGGSHEGEIFLAGRNVAETDIFDLTKSFGIVTQDFRNQLMASGIEQAVAFPLENQAMPYSQMHARVNEVLTLMNLEDLRGRDISQLSGGEGQRVVIASMLAKNPRVMIFDDVASELDPAGQKEIQKTMSLLKERGVTLLVVDSADPVNLLKMADKALILEEGQQTFFGPPTHILADENLAYKAGAFIPKVEFRQASHSPIALTAHSVDFSYDGHLAVKDVSCQIKEGAITGIIGHNGSGKTTLAKLIAGLYRPSKGEIIINEAKAGTLAPSKMVREVAYLHQNAGEIFFTDSVIKELGYTPYAVGINSRILPETIGLEGLENEHPSYLSAGQKQRLAIGCALSADPKILIFDEPTTGLNQLERERLSRHLLQLQEEGKTIIIISHDWPMIARVAEDILVMDHGLLVNQGAANEILQDRTFFNRIGLPLPW